MLFNHHLEMWSVVVVLFNVLPYSAPLPEIIKIGGLFDVTDKFKSEGKQETAFRYAVERINHNKHLLPQSRLSAQIEKIPPHDSFHASKRVCHLLRSGVAALFGPESGTTSSHVQSICDAMEIPHIETRWDYMLKRDEYSINLYPHPTLISKAFVQLIESFGWKSFTILYQDNQGLVRLQELLKSPTTSDIKTVVRQLYSDRKDNKELLREVKKTGEIHIVLDCDNDNIKEVLKDAQAVGMMTAYHNYLITSLDLHLVNLDDFKYGGTNLTAFRLVDPENPEVKDVIQKWMLGEQRFPDRRVFSGGSVINDYYIKTETALIYDAVHLFANALHDLDRSQDITTKALSCDGDETWRYGNSLVNFMKLVEMRGLTGKIKFDQHGLRTDFQLEIVELKKDGLVKVGAWTEKSGINFTRNFTETYTEIVESLQNKTLIVTTIMSPPYSMFKESAKSLRGNDAFEGYAIDLIDAISKILKFNYTLKWVEDGNYGVKNKETGEWNGLMGELLAQPRVADMAIADLTMTSARTEVADFTMPFMKIGISILYKAPEKKPPTITAFMDPFSHGIWACLIASYLAVGVGMYFIARFTPMEWVILDECDKVAAGDFVETDLTLKHCLWWSIAAATWMGCEVCPKALSTRLVAGCWYLIIVIMLSSFIANLAASLTAETLDSPITSVEELGAQDTIKYGCVTGGSTCGFFQKKDQRELYAHMGRVMNENPDVFVDSNNEGIAKVKKEDGRYAFFMESSSIEYNVERNCDLAQVGGNLDTKGYGIAFKKGTPYVKQFSYALNLLEERGVMHKLKIRWWKERRGAKNCAAKSAQGAKSLTLANVAGAFFVLSIFLGAATITAFVEFLWASRTIVKRKNHDTVGELRREVTSQFGRRHRKQNICSGGRGRRECSETGDSISQKSFVQKNLAEEGKQQVKWNDTQNDPLRQTSKSKSKSVESNGMGKMDAHAGRRQSLRSIVEPYETPSGILGGSVSTSSSETTFSLESIH